MTKLPEHIRTSPMVLVCPHCHAVAGQVCGVVAGALELVHVERIAAGAAKTVETRIKRREPLHFLARKNEIP
jgi:hypothetical protein